jgi:hypothetical protein
MDHSKQDYVEIEKCFYEEHEDIAKLSEEQVRQIRQDLGQFNDFLFTAWLVHMGPAFVLICFYLLITQI